MEKSRRINCMLACLTVSKTTLYIKELQMLSFKITGVEKSSTPVTEIRVIEIYRNLTNF